MGRKSNEIKPINDVSFEVLFDFCIGRKNVPKDEKIIEKTTQKPIKKDDTELKKKQPKNK